MFIQTKHINISKIIYMFKTLRPKGSDQKHEQNPNMPIRNPRKPMLPSTNLRNMDCQTEKQQMTLLFFGEMPFGRKN